MICGGGRPPAQETRTKASTIINRLWVIRGWQLPKRVSTGYIGDDLEQIVLDRQESSCPQSNWESRIIWLSSSFDPRLLIVSSPPMMPCTASSESLAFVGTSASSAMTSSKPFLTAILRIQCFGIGIFGFRGNFSASWASVGDRWMKLRGVGWGGGWIFS